MTARENVIDRGWKRSRAARLRRGWHALLGLDWKGLRAKLWRIQDSMIGV